MPLSIANNLDLIMLGVAVLGAALIAYGFWNLHDSSPY